MSTTQQPLISEVAAAIFALAGKVEKRGLSDLAWELGVIAANRAIDDYPIDFRPYKERK